jgi:pyruvate,orthophosphate dikinase
MTLLGVPVPAGFTITTQACRDYMHGGRQMPEGLADEVEEHVRRSRRAAASASATAPTRCSSRALGAAVSMPGMMDTILNVGLDDESVEGLAERSGNRASPTTRTGA